MYSIKIIDTQETHSTHSSLAAAATVARILNFDHGYQFCYVWGANEGLPFNPDYVGTTGQRASTKVLLDNLSN